MKRGALVAIVTAVVAPGLTPAARSAEPSSATLSMASPGADWTGQIAPGLSYTTFFAGAGQCAPDGSCDSFTFSVVDAGAASLAIRVVPNPETDSGAFEVVLPDGSRHYVPPTAPGGTSAVFKAPATGEFTVNVVNNTGLGDTYTGTVRLKYPTPPAAPAPAPAPLPTTPAPPAPAAPKPTSKERRAAKAAACRKKARRIKSAKRRRAALKRCAADRRRR